MIWVNSAKQMLITNRYQILVIKIKQKNELYRDPTINAFVIARTAINNY